MQEEVIFRKATYNELKPLLRMRRESVALHDTANTEYIGAFIDGKIVGVAGWMMVGNVLRYKSLCVLPKYRNRGIGGKLYEQREEACKGLAISTTVFATSMSRGIHLAHGFKIVRDGKIAFMRRYEYERL